MTALSWIRTLFAGPPRPARRAPARFRPRLEALGNRTLPATIPVTTFADVVAADGLTSLREAIAQAAASPGEDTVQLPAGTYDLLGQLIIADATGAVKLQAPEAGATIDAGGNSRVFLIFPGSTAEFVHLTLTGGSAIFGSGGGIVNFGTLTLTQSTVSGNSTIFGGGGIANTGTLTLTASTVSDNTAGTVGGGIANSGTLTLTNSTVGDNTAIADGGGIWNSRALTLTNSTVSGNSAGTIGGGIQNGGTLTLTNSTISDNNASSGGGIYNFGTLTLKNSTVSGNSASNGGGIRNFGTLTLKNSRVSENLGGDIVGP